MEDPSSPVLAGNARESLLIQWPWTENDDTLHMEKWGAYRGTGHVHPLSQPEDIWEHGGPQGFILYLFLTPLLHHPLLLLHCGHLILIRRLSLTLPPRTNTDKRQETLKPQEKYNQ